MRDIDAASAACLSAHDAHKHVILEQVQRFIANHWPCVCTKVSCLFTDEEERAEGGPASERVQKGPCDAAMPTPTADSVHS